MTMTVAIQRNTHLCRLLEQHLIKAIITSQEVISSTPCNIPKLEKLLAYLFYSTE